MRLVDEITEPPAPQALPAPSGPRAPTGSIPLIVATPATPPAMSAPVLPHLPPVQPKIAPATTGPVANTAFAAATRTLSNPVAHTTTPLKPKRNRKGLIVLAGIVLVPMVLGVIFRNTAFVERFTGKGYDTNPLPTHGFGKPLFTGSEYTVTSQTMSITDGLPTNFWDTEHVVVDYTAGAAKSTIDRAKASVIGGTISTPQAVTKPLDIFIDQQSFYRPGETPTDPWIRVPLSTGWTTQAVLRPDTILMYQDVIDPTLRNQVPTSVKNETRHETPVKTYSYTFTFGDFYESAPRLFELFRVVDGNAAADATVNVTVSLDDQWVVRYLDVNVDYHSVIEHRAKKDVGTHYPYRLTMDVIKVTDKPETVHIPIDVIDETTTTTTLPAVPAVTP